MAGKMNQINETDRRIIAGLRRLVGGEFPQVEELKSWQRGYAVDDAGAVTGLSLARCGIGDKGLAAASEYLAVLLALAVLYAPEWKVKAALLTGALAASLSIIFNPKTWHRRTALCLLFLVGAAQFGFGLYARGGYLVLSGPAVVVQVLIVLAAVVIYVTGEIFSKRNV